MSNGPAGIHTRRAVHFVIRNVCIGTLHRVCFPIERAFDVIAHRCSLTGRISHKCRRPAGNRATRRGCGRQGRLPVKSL